MLNWADQTSNRTSYSASSKRASWIAWSPTRHAILPQLKRLSLYLTKIARLGAYLARAKDPPPGNIVMWRGLSRLNDITLGATLQADVVGSRETSG